MNGKKNRERFSIKFNGNDPAHDAVIRLLEKQGPHSKAQFIVNAVLHYINCPEAPDISCPQAADRAFIEEIVMEILGRNEELPQNRADKVEAEPEVGKEPAFARAEGELDEKADRQGMDTVTLSLIANTLSAFRSN